MAALRVVEVRVETGSIMQQVDEYLLVRDIKREARKELLNELKSPDTALPPMTQSRFSADKSIRLRKHWRLR